LNKIFTTSMLAAFAAAQTSGKVPDNQKDSDYPEIAAFFDFGGEYSDYDWEAHEVVTESGTIKTLFHLLPALGTE